MIAAGVDVLTISRRLGHATPAFTLAVYGHLFRKYGRCRGKGDRRGHGCQITIDAGANPVPILGLCPSEGSAKELTNERMCRVSTVAVQRFCKPKVGGSNPSPGTGAPAAQRTTPRWRKAAISAAE